MFDKWVLALNTEYGVIFPYGGEEIPIHERFYVGGANSVRGYSRGALPPLIISEVLGFIMAVTGTGMLMMFVSAVRKSLCLMLKCVTPLLRCFRE